MSVDAHFTLGFIKKVNRTMNEIVSPTLRPSLERRARCYRRNATSLRRPNARRSDPSAHQSSNDLACCSLGYDPKKDTFIEHISVSALILVGMTGFKHVSADSEK